VSEETGVNGSVISLKEEMLASEGMAGCMSAIFCAEKAICALACG
jgi:hypothetical protein